MSMVTRPVNAEDRGYLFDPAWNLNQWTNNGSVMNFMMNEKNELTNVANTTVTYDANGNMTYEPFWGRTFVYDDENQLKYWIGGGFRALFVYDGMGRLRTVQEEEEYFDGNEWLWYTASSKRYVYDGFRVIQERGENHTPSVSYTRGNDLSGSMEGAGGIGGLLARSHGYSGGNFSTHNYYHADGNGNITYMINNSQAMVASYKYDPFGNAISISGTLGYANIYRFSSKEYHAAGEMYYYGYRWYHPQLHRWVNRDPIGEGGGLNLYGFIGNRAVNSIDLFGLKLITFNVTWGEGLRNQANRGRLQRNLDRLRSLLGDCCNEHGVGCGVQVNASLGGAGGLPLRMVHGPLDEESTARASENGPINWDIDQARQSDNVLSHELGHVGGYSDSTNEDDEKHSSDPTNIMFYQDRGGKNVDKCFCKSIAKLAK